MTRFVKYDPVDGRILYTGDVPESMVALQGGDVLVGEGGDETHYVDVARKVIVRKPARPSTNHVFDHATRVWVFDKAALAEQVRLERARLLKACDWTQLPDVPLATKEPWATYRQALRDITEQPGFPESVVWPEPPS